MLTNVNDADTWGVHGLSESELDKILAVLAERLTDRQRLFADCLVAGRSQTDAYRAAGYSNKAGTPKAAASRLIKSKNVSLYVEILREQMRRNASVTRERMIRKFLDTGNICVELGQYSVACSHWREAAKLADLYPRKRHHIQVETTVTDATQLSTEAWEAMFSMELRQGIDRHSDK